MVKRKTDTERKSERTKVAGEERSTEQNSSSSSRKEEEQITSHERRWRLICPGVGASYFRPKQKPKGVVPVAVVLRFNHELDGE
ncbi:hypothetical protein niasHS_015973 [Heterodera schachtii]|uniref:Uncharacterized protein n=1 Tax=Heterodera schachtii TaxID=97005 RepID=A0ABD2HPS9_HETSC